MNQDDSGVFHTEHDTSDTGASSLNNSLSEEEFAIVDNVDAAESGSLKLTILCRRKSSDNEVDEYSTIMNDNKVLPSHANDEDCNKALSSELQVSQNAKDDSESCHGDKDLLQHSNIPDNLNHCADGSSESDSSCARIRPISDSKPLDNEKLNIACSDGGDFQEFEIIADTSNLSDFSQSTPVLPLSIEAGSSVNLSEVDKEVKIDKVLNQPQDVPDPVLRLDHLPNVSPDSGVVSLDESPVGNESPNSVANGDTPSDCQHGSSVSLSAKLDEKKSVLIDTVSINDGSASVKVSKAEGNSGGELKDEGLISELLSNSTPSDICHGLTVDINTAVGKRSMVSPSTASKLSPLPSSKGIIVSSPHKINHTSGRKKRGRPPGKNNKTFLLQHKKSVLYSNAYDKEQPVPASNTACENPGTPAADTEVSIAQVNINVDNGTPKNDKEVCEKPVDITMDSGILKGDKEEVSERTVNTVDNGIPKNDKEEISEKIDHTKKGPGRPKKEPTDGHIKRPRGRPKAKPLTGLCEDSLMDSPEKKPKLKRKVGRKKGFTSKKTKSTVDRPQLSVTETPVTVETTNGPVMHNVVEISPAAVVIDSLDQDVMKKQIKQLHKRPYQRKSKDLPVKRPYNKKNKEQILKTKRPYNKKIKDTHIESQPAKRPYNRKKKDSVQNELKAGQLGRELSSIVSHETTSSANTSSKDVLRRLPEKSVFQDEGLDALLLSVKTSISSQFREPEEENHEIASLSFENPFKAMQPHPFPKVCYPDAHKPAILKPKAKKPKLHVMMRGTKRKKKKKSCAVTPVNPPSPIETVEVEPHAQTPNQLNMFTDFHAHRKFGKFGAMPHDKSRGMFGSGTSQKRMSFFLSGNKPSKILASSRLNVFDTGTGADTQLRFNDVELSDGSDKNKKKRHRLLYRKSKHKNIVDPVFSEDLDILVDGVGGMAVSENKAVISVRPGEMPLPSIFRVTKIDVNKRPKSYPLDSVSLDRSKAFKSRKDSPSPNNNRTFTAFKTVVAYNKSMAKKSVPDLMSEQQDSSYISDSSDQCLPPKKRHRLVNIDSTDGHSKHFSQYDASLNEKSESLTTNRSSIKRPKKSFGDGNKLGDKIYQKNLGQLTIDTSSYSTGSTNCTPSPASTAPSFTSCPSRLSTRSSTAHSLSSPSPTGSSFTGRRQFSSRSSSFLLSSLGCPVHSMSGTSEDKLSCAECQLLEQSLSPSLLRSQPLSFSQLGHSSSDRLFSSCEPSPVPKFSDTVMDKRRGKNSRKRRKSSNHSDYESDSSPPRLTLTSTISPNGYQDSEVFSEPPEITDSPSKSVTISPHGISTEPYTHIQSHPGLNYTRNGETVSPNSNRTLRQGAKALSPHFPRMFSTSKQCNIRSKGVFTSGRSAANVSELSEFHPLPLEHCTRKKLVDEIKAALHVSSSDDCSSSEEDDELCTSEPSKNTSAQPPRKRFQRVGLYSDFYKDEEPRKRCVAMAKCSSKLVYVKEEHQEGLMPLPVHIGHWYMQEVRDFVLPYDIWWQHQHQQLPKKSDNKPKFRTIRSNVYSDNKVSKAKLEGPPMCCCKPNPFNNKTKGCLEDCLNRMIYTECVAGSCPLGDNCDNQKIQRQQWTEGLEKFITSDRGAGVRTTTAIKHNQLILEYLGEVISEAELRRRMMEEYSEDCHHYALHLATGLVIDGYRMGNIARYVNHSCQPNCEMQKWNVNGLYRMVLFALRDIEPGEELSYDYNFDCFNQETQQLCRCGAQECRGVIGGKTQKSSSGSGKTIEDSKDKRKNSKVLNKKSKDKFQPRDNVTVQPMAKPMTLKERCYARKHRTFLVRNVDKVRNQRHGGEEMSQWHTGAVTKEDISPLDCGSVGTLPDLTCVKARLAAYNKDTPEMARRHKLTPLLDRMLTELLALSDEDGDSLVTPLMSLPSRKKQPGYYIVVKEPIDLSMIKQRVKTGHYEHMKDFNADLMLLFSNVELYCGPKSDLGQIILKLRRILSCVKQDVWHQVDELLGPGSMKMCIDTELDRIDSQACKVHHEPEEDIIRCICGVTRDEGLMLQCEKCMRWQHCDCVQASGKEETYLCDRCEPRYYDPEILLNPPPPDALPDCTHYMTLVKDDVQYAAGDCVYVMRDCKRTATGAPLRSSHRLMASVNPDKLDIFRLEQLWKDPKGEKFASGTPYLRPQETFHEPTRKFYHNELFRTPNFEIIPLELVMGKCVVMDPNTFSKGRPKGVREQDCYICEYRVDKTAHLFHIIKKHWYPINTGKFCFDWHESRLTLKRTFSPHEVPEEYKSKAERARASGSTSKATGKNESEDKCEVKKTKSGSIANNKVTVDESIKNDLKLKAEVKVNVNMKGQVCSTKSKGAMQEKVRIKKRNLDKILQKLLNAVPGKQKVDLTYLLDLGKRVRKKPAK